ncbi:MAG: hypothetical protein AAF614_40205, partial [Chloroflexota bacterium]
VLGGGNSHTLLSLFASTQSAIGSKTPSSSQEGAYLTAPSQARATLTTTVTLLSKYGRDDLTKLVTKLEKRFDALLASPLQLEECLAFVRAELRPAIEKKFCGVWQQL